MGLKLLKPTLGTAAPRLGYLPSDEAAADRQRDRLAPWRQWYKSKRWYQLRYQVFVRDGFVCQRTGRLCSGKHPHPDSPVANHKVPHRGDPLLFWDINNVETVTKAVHDSTIQSEERRQYPGG